MAQELIYTSAERGLRLGTHGFCTVAHTVGMTPQSIQLLEALSTYKSAYTLNEESQGKTSPVSWSHCRGNFLGHQFSVLSRISATSADHTNRSNKIAHHLLISQREHAVGGPVWLCRQPHVFLEAWDGEPKLLQESRSLPEGDETDFTATTWQTVTGDAGHAWQLASAFLADPRRITVLVFAPGMPMLDLLGEALRLLPADVRWQVTFNTYFTSLPAGATCAWRCCLAGSEELRQQMRIPRATVMDMTKPLPEVSPCRQVSLARGLVDPLPESSPSPVSDVPKAVPFRLMKQGHINQITLRPRGPESRS